MTTLLQFAEKMAKAPAQIDAAKKEMVTAAALAITTSVRTEISAATGGTNRLSGVGRRGARVGAGFNVKGTAHPTAIVQARGPLHLLERDTKAHDIKPRRRRALAGKGFGPVAVVHSPGSHGKHPFERGVVAGVPLGMKAASTVLTGAMVKVVKG